MIMDRESMSMVIRTRSWSMPVSQVLVVEALDGVRRHHGSTVTQWDEVVQQARLLGGIRILVDLSAACVICQ
jgi:hypothetical protein